MKEITKILLMGKNGYYHLAKKDKDGTNLKQDKEALKVNAGGLVPYGFTFEFGGGLAQVSFGIFGYGHINYAIEEKEGKLKSNEDYGRVNLDRTIEGLEKMVVDKGADYVLISDLISRDMHTSWHINGKAQLLVWSESIKEQKEELLLWFESIKNQDKSKEP